MIGNNRTVAQLWEREFDIVKPELPQSQVITSVAELIDQQKILAERLKQLTIAHDRLLFYFKNLIAETRILEEQIGNAATGGAQEDETGIFGLSLSASEAGNNGHQESLELEGEGEPRPALMSASQEETPEEAIGSTDESAVLISLPEDSPIFEGEVEIIIAPPVDMAKLVRLRRTLQSVVHLKILRTDGCWTGTNVFTAFIDRPLPLISTLMRIPEVKKADLWTNREDGINDGFPWGLALEEKLGNWLVQKVIVWLKSV